MNDTRRQSLFARVSDISACLRDIRDDLYGDLDDAASAAQMGQRFAALRDTINRAEKETAAYVEAAVREAGEEG